MTLSTVAWLPIAARLFGALSVHVLWRAVVGPWWWMIAAGVALVLGSTLVPAPGPPLPHGLLISIVCELLLGAVLGLAASLPGYAVIGAATASATALRSSPRPMVALYCTLVLALSLQLDLHQPLLVALRGSLDLFPLADVERWADLAATRGAALLVPLLHTLLVLALALATPVLLTVAVVDIGTGLLSQGPAPAPQIAPVLRAGARTAAALVALGASWAAYGESWARAFTS